VCAATGDAANPRSVHGARCRIASRPASWCCTLRRRRSSTASNASDFRRLYAAQPLHVGLVILIPAVSRELQKKLFRAALDELAVIGEPVNRVLEVDLDGEAGFQQQDLRVRVLGEPVGHYCRREMPER
jgi:hypothetical protein